MIQLIYKEIFERLDSVKDWLTRGDDFVLKKDQDSGHDTRPTSMMRAYKKELGLEYYFNAFASPDLIIVKNCFQSLKHHMETMTIWDEETLMKELQEAWNTKIKQQWSNDKILEMPKRLQDCKRAVYKCLAWCLELRSACLRDRVFFGSMEPFN